MKFVTDTKYFQEFFKYYKRAELKVDWDKPKSKRGVHKYFTSEEFFNRLENLIERVRPRNGKPKRKNI